MIKLIPLWSASKILVEIDSKIIQKTFIRYVAYQKLHIYGIGICHFVSFNF